MKDFFAIVAGCLGAACILLLHLIIYGGVCCLAIWLFWKTLRLFGVV